MSKRAADIDHAYAEAAGTLPEATQRNVLAEAESLIYGARAAEYGDMAPAQDRLAKMWGAVLGVEVTGEQVALCMVLLKAARIAGDIADGRAIKRDSVVDMAGWTGVLGGVLEERAS